MCDNIINSIEIEIKLINYQQNFLKITFRLFHQLILFIAKMVVYLHILGHQFKR